MKLKFQFVNAFRLNWSSAGRYGRSLHAARTKAAITPKLILNLSPGTIWHGGRRRVSGAGSERICTR